MRETLKNLCVSQQPQDALLRATPCSKILLCWNQLRPLRRILHLPPHLRKLVA